MASWQAHALDLLMRVNVKWRMRGATDIEKVRRALAGGVPKPQPGVTFRPDTLGGVAGEWAEGEAPAEATMLYMHGGGYFACSPRTHRPITAAYARRGFRVFAPDYRLAPEHLFPAAVEDGVAAWQGLVDSGIPPARLVVSGDSAGGGLALAVLVKLRDDGLGLPAAAALLSPWTDLAVTGESVITNAGREAMLWGPGLATGARLYLGRAKATHPLASPLYADLAGLPPLAVHVGAREVLLDDSRRLADRARAAGVPVQLRIWPVLPHVWQLAAGFVPEAAESMAELSGFLLDAVRGRAVG